jgi:DNA repair exonuclease SbcCD ATPase subunit
MIEKIAHISDVHIHKDPARHKEYREQFEKLYASLEEQKPDRIVIVGDLYHDYINLEGEAEILMGEFLNRLSQLTNKVIITRGNHDLRKKALKRTDTVETITTLIANPKVVYFNKSDYYLDENVVWVVHHHREDVNPWVTIPHTRDKNKIYIDLYHNPIQGCLGHNGFLLKNDKYTLSDFKGDYSFFGDLHLRQFFKKKRMAYPSSLIGQDFGESPEKHGYLLWNIINNTVKEIDIPNNNNYINFIVSTHTDYDALDLIHPLLNPLSNVKITWTDLSANVNFENEVKIRNYFKNTYNILGIKIVRTPQYTDVADVDMVNESIDVLNPETHREIFVEYLVANGYDEKFKKEILKIDDIITSNLNLGDENKGVTWDIEKIWFNNFKSYGDNVEIDFKKMGSNSLIQVSGENQGGKTSILDAISYILYGTTTTTQKRQKNGDVRYMNKMRNLDYVGGGAIISINNETYTLVRRSERKWNRAKTEVSSCSSTLDFYKGNIIDEDNKLTGELKIKTQEFIDSSIGNFDDFVRLVLTNADSLNDFLSMDRAVFIDSIIRDAGYDIFEKKTEEFKTYRKNLIKNDIKINVDSSKKQVEEKDLEEDLLIDQQEELEKKLKELEDSKPELQTKKDELLSSLDKIDDRISNLNLIEVNEKIEEEKEKIKTKKEQLTKITELKIEVSNYNSDTIKQKRIEYDKLKDLISENNIKVGNFTNQITTITSRINTLNMDIKNIVDGHIRDIEKESKENELDLSKVKDEFNTKVIEYSNVLKQDLNKIIAQKDAYKKEIDNFMEDGKKLKKLNDELETSKICIMCERPLDPPDLVVINKKVEQNKSEMGKIISKIKTLKPKYDELSESIDKYRIKLDKLSKKEYDFDEELQKSYLNYIDKKNKTAETNLEIERRIKLIKDGNLPTEVQVKLKSSYDEKRIKNDKITELENEKKELEKVIMSKKEESETLSTEISELEKEEIKIQKKKDAIHLEEKIKSDIDKFENIIKQYEKDVELYNSELEKIENNKKIKEDIDTVNDMITLLEEDIKTKTTEKTDIEKKIAVLDNEIERILKDITIYEKQMSRDEILDEYMKCVHRDGLPSFLLKKSVHLINQELTNILTDVDFNLYFDEELNLKLAHDIKVEASQNAIESCGMERTFAAIALKMALRKINNKSKPNFILLDEIMVKLLNASVDKFITLLDSIKTQVDKLIIIEHIHPINYDVLIEVTKDESGISSLKIED